MRKRLIGFCHPVCVFFLLKSTAFPLACSEDFAGQFVGHAFAVSFPAETYQPFNTQGNLTVRTNFCRNLKSCTTDTTASYFNSWRYIVQCPSPDFISVVVGLFRNTVDGIVKQTESSILFTLPHQVVY